MKVNEIRLGISSSPVSAKTAARKAFVSSYKMPSGVSPKPVAMKKRFVPNAKPDLYEMDDGGGDAADDDGPPSDDFLPSSPRKMYRLNSPLPSCWGARWLVWGWLFTLTVFVLFHLAWSATSLPPPVAPIVELKKNRVKHTIQFIIVPDPDTGGRLMNISVKKTVFDRLLRYDVCCFVQSYFVCRSVTRNVGVECFFESSGNVLVQVNHPNMVGARCHLIWTENI